MLTDKMEQALNDQINAELYSAYLYWSMSAYCQSLDLVGMANWFKVQAQEELFHASKFFNYICDRGARAGLQPVKGPPPEWDSPLGAFSEAHKHELHVTKLIHDLVSVAQSENDRATENFLQWFVTEQVEEEAAASQIVGQLKLAGTTGPGLFMIDQQLATRTFVMPTAAPQ